MTNIHKKIIIFTLMFLILTVSSVLGFSEWTGTGGNLENHNIGSYLFPSDIDNLSDAPQELSTSMNSGTSPIIFDYNFDGKNEVLVAHGTKIKVYNVSYDKLFGDDVTTLLEVEFDSTISSPPTLTDSTSFFGGESWTVAGLIENGTTDIFYGMIFRNGSITYITKSVEFLEGSTDIKCFATGEESNIGVDCVFVSSTSEIGYYDNTVNSIYTKDLGHTYTALRPTTMVYVESDNTIVLPYDTGLVAYDISSPSNITNKTSYFTNGVYSISTDSPLVIGGLLNTYDYTANNYFCFTRGEDRDRYGTSADADAGRVYGVCIDSSSTLIVNNHLTDGTGRSSISVNKWWTNSKYAMTSPFIIRYDISEYAVCFTNPSSSEDDINVQYTEVQKVSCFSLDDYDELIEQQTIGSYTGGNLFSDYLTSVSSCMLENDIYSDIVWSEGYIERPNSTTLNYFSDWDSTLTSNPHEGFSACGDVNSDGYGDILVGTALNTLEIYLSNEANFDSPLTLIGEVYNYDSEDNCLGDIEFKAVECIGGDFTDCTYSSSVNDSIERMCVKCDDDVSFTCGSYSSTHPSVTCNYNTTGTYNERIYIQSNYAPTDYTIYDDITFSVQNGTTCNSNPIEEEDIFVNETAVDEVDEEDAVPQYTSDEETNNAINIIFGADDFWKLIFAVVLSVAVMIGIIEKTKKTFAGLIGFGACWVVCTVLGLVDIWITILIVLVGVGLGFLYKTIIANNRG